VSSLAHYSVSLAIKITLWWGYWSSPPPCAKITTPLEISLNLSKVLGKLESSPQGCPKDSPHYLPYHAHVTALTVAPSYRRLGHAQLLTASLEAAGNANNAWFVDLFVRESNKVAINMYEKMGYSVFRRVVGYYSGKVGAKEAGDEDGFDMRKPLDRDVKKIHIREKGESFKVYPQDVW
jgi:N-terminal acetyltransferase B complex catalytic subunit